MLERVRAWVLYRLRETSLRKLAGETKISKSSIEKFSKGLALPQKNWPKLRLWYLKDRRARYGLEESADMVLLVIETLSAIPEEERPDAIRKTAAHFEEIHRKAYSPRPEWVDALLQYADELEKEQGQPRPKKEATYETPKKRAASRRKKEAEEGGEA